MSRDVMLFRFFQRSRNPLQKFHALTILLRLVVLEFPYFVPLLLFLSLAQIENYIDEFSIEKLVKFPVEKSCKRPTINEPPKRNCKYE
jgi:hypothetical protein